MEEKSSCKLSTWTPDATKRCKEDTAWTMSLADPTSLESPMFTRCMDPRDLTADTCVWKNWFRVLLATRLMLSNMLGGTTTPKQSNRMSLKATEAAKAEAIQN